jgi:hypothetical protein
MKEGRGGARGSLRARVPPRCVTPCFPTSFFFITLRALTAALSCSNCRLILLQLTPYPTNCPPILPTAALSRQLTPYPTNPHLILPTTALSCQLTPNPAMTGDSGGALGCPRGRAWPPYPANCRLIYQLPPYPTSGRPILPTAALSCSNCRPILLQLPPYPAPTAAVSYQLTPYPAN